MSKTIKLRVTSKAQNAILARLVDQYGSATAAAAAIGVSAATLRLWLNLKAAIPSDPVYIRKRAKLYARVIPRLEQLTGRQFPAFSIATTMLAEMRRPTALPTAFRSGSEIARCPLSTLWRFCRCRPASRATCAAGLPERLMAALMRRASLALSCSAWWIMPEL